MAANGKLCLLIIYVIIVLSPISLTVDSTNIGEHVIQFEQSANSAQAALQSVSFPDRSFRRRRDTSSTNQPDPTCKKQEDTFLTDLRKGQRIESQYVFANRTSFSLALAWAGENDEGTMIVVTAEIIFGIMRKSNVWRSTNYGRTWTNIDAQINNVVIRKGNGLQRNTHNPQKVYLLTYEESALITEDGGKNFEKRKLVNVGSTVSQQVVFHPDNYEDYVLAISDARELYLTVNNFRDYTMIRKDVVTARWGTKESGNPKAVYMMVGKVRTFNPFMPNNKPTMYKLYKSEDGTQEATIILERVVAFGIQGKFLYASVFKEDNPSMNSGRLLMVSTDGGKTWNEAQLPTVTGDRFYTVLDMTEGLIFMHVDNPGDTGHGTLYTSSSQGIVYSKSLQRHLYPNYGSVTDFYKVLSMRGVYLASQINEDNSIHTMITFNRGATWQQISPPEGQQCKPGVKNCYLQIHNYYSISKGVAARAPLSAESATGIVLVHAHVADALQTTPPDVYITTDGGYTWRKTLDGPHDYKIGDSGGLLVAVSIAKSTADTVKFSTDEGRCWHDYKFTNMSLVFTGLLIEPGSKSVTVSIWGYTTSDRKWVVHVINFADVIKKRCDDSAYEVWTAHSLLRKEENKGVEGCLLGVREKFRRLKKDSWCRNGYSFNHQKQSETCVCTREDYECDYSYYRPKGSDDCLKDPEFKGEKVEICLRGHEEKLVTKGYRKIPGDICTGGFKIKGELVDLSQKCVAGDKSKVKEEVNAKESPKANYSTVVAVIVIIVLILIATTMSFFIYKVYLLRKHKVVYRYSLLSQSGDRDYDNEFENALTQHETLYQDSDDEELMRGSSKRKENSKNAKHKVKSFHDESDDDMLE